MGTDPVAGAVVGSGGAVHGIDGLYVADASVMPEIPSANTHIATIMLAERISSLIAAGGSGWIWARTRVPELRTAVSDGGRLMVMRHVIAGQADRGRPPILLRSPAARERVAVVLGLLAITAAGGVTGFVSVFSGIAAESCATTRCSQTVGTLWVVLIVTQLAIGGAALLGAALARRPVQLTVAVVLGTTGPFVAFWAFVIVARQVTGGPH